MVEFYIYNFKINLFISACFNYIFLADLFTSFSNACLIIFGVFLIIPFSYMLPYLLGVNEEGVAVDEFNSVYMQFFTDYERSNPITSKKGWEKYYSFLYDNKKITEEQLKKFLSDLKSNEMH